MHFDLKVLELAVSYKLSKIFISMINPYRDFGAPSSSKSGVDRTHRTPIATLLWG